MAEKQSAADIIYHHVNELTKAARFKMDPRMVEIHANGIMELFSDMHAKITGYQTNSRREELTKIIAALPDGTELPRPESGRIRNVLVSIAEQLREGAAQSDRYGRVIGMFGLAEVAQMQKEYSAFQLNHAERFEAFIKTLEE